MVKKTCQKLSDEQFNALQNSIQHYGGVKFEHRGKKYLFDFMDTSEENNIIIFACDTSNYSKRCEFVFTRRN